MTQNERDPRNPYEPPAETAVAQARYPITTPFQETMTIHKVGGILFAVAVVIPAMIMGNIFRDWNTLSATTWVAISALGSALSGALFVHRRAPYYVGALGGVLIAPGALLAISWWVGGRTSVFRIEVAIAFLIGAAPGALAYSWLFKRVVGTPSAPTP